jgi:hypothetical protein
VSQNRILYRIIVIIGLCFIGCIRASNTGSGYRYPDIPAACFCENDPNVTKSGHLGKVQPVPVQEILVIPVYRNYSQNGSLYLAIAHPFVYKQGDDIEKSLVAFGRREHLQKLVFWIPGYFPIDIPRIFRTTGEMDGKYVFVEEVQRCLGQEEDELNSAMKTLLEKEYFIVQEGIQRKRPGYSDIPILTNDPYDFRQLVQSYGYQSRYFQYGCSCDYSLWNPPAGTKIVNEFSANEKKIVAIFADKVMKKTSKQSSIIAKEQSKE